MVRKREKPRSWWSGKEELRAGGSQTLRWSRPRQKKGGEGWQELVGGGGGRSRDSESKRSGAKGGEGGVGWGGTGGGGPAGEGTG